MRIEIPQDCLSCRFFSETEDGDCYCAIYDEEWEYDEDGSYTGTQFNEGEKPAFCKAEYVQVVP